MDQRYIAHVTLVVKDYDEAIAFYTQKLDFVLLEDTWIDNEKRWVRVAPTESAGCSILLAKASTSKQLQHVGSQTGGRVFFFLYTDNFQRDYDQMLSRGVSFVRPPKSEPYGTVAVFQDLYGNLWDLLEPKDKQDSIQSDCL